MSEYIEINGVMFDREAVDKMFKKDAAKIWAKGRKAMLQKEGKAAVRMAIKKKVGDTEAILGTTADVTQLNAAAVLAFISAMKTGDSFAKFRAQFMGTIEALVPAKSDEPDVYAQAAQFLALVQSGDIILTAAMKGLPEVMSEMATRSTGVATVLAAAQAGGK